MPEARLERTREAYRIIDEAYVDDADSVVEFALRHIRNGGVIDEAYINDPRRLALIRKRNMK